jgi:peptidoglycan hydrolase-like protein with peptidoglycan-binding domain
LVTEDNAKTYYLHTEHDVPRGFFPIGHNTVWHGGVHVYANEGTPIRAMYDGVVVAARLNGDAEAATGEYGSSNFIVVHHRLRGDAINTVQDGSPHKAWKKFDLYSVYMHVGALALEAGNAALGKVAWLTAPPEHEFSASVGAGGKNAKADVELIQTMLTSINIDPGPIDGAIGSKTIGAIRTFQDTYLYSNPDGRIDVGGSSWDALAWAANGTPERDGIDEDLLGQLAEGAVVAPNKRIAGGQTLWAVGPDAPNESTYMFQWEVISGENIFPDFKEVVDDAAYTGNPATILQKLGGTSWINGEVTGSAVAEFFASNAQAPLLREYAVKFRSEWSVEADAMIEALGDRYYVEGLAEAIAPYMWYGDTKVLPDPVHYHYNPIRVAELIAEMDFKRTLPPPPPPPPPPEEDDTSDETTDSEDSVVPSGEAFLLYDAGKDLVYSITAADLAKVMAANDKLAKKRDAFEKALKAAKDLPLDQRENAVKPTLDELAELTNKAPDGNNHEPPQSFVREFWYRDEDGNTKPLYVGEKQFKGVTDRLNGSKLKDKIKIKGTKAHPAAARGARAEVELLDHTFFKDEGSLLDFIDSSSPSLLAYMLGPVTGADYFFEKFPRVFRKGFGDKWESPDGHFAASAEAKFLRFSYQAKAQSMYDPLRGKIDAKIGIGGSVSLMEGKADLNAYLPNKKGFALPVSEGEDLRSRFKFYGEVSGFVGAIGELSAGAALSWKPQVDEDDDFMGVRCEAGLEAFAGAKVQGKVGVAIEWFNPDPAENKWKVLAEFSAGVTFAAGIGITAKFYLDFDAKSGSFKFYCKLEIVVKLGMGTEYKGKISIKEIFDFLWALLTRADWGKIAEMSFNAFIEASKMMVGSAMMGVLGPVGVGIYLLASFGSWWNDQGKITDMADNILADKAPYLLKKGTPEAKGMAIYRLTQASWMWDETSETASLKVLKSAKHKREAEKILKSIDPDGRDPDVSPADRSSARTVQRGYDLLSGLVDWGEQTQLDEYLAGLGITVS